MIIIRNGAITFVSQSETHSSGLLGEFVELGKRLDQVKVSATHWWTFCLATVDPRNVDAIRTMCQVIPPTTKFHIPSDAFSSSCLWSNDAGSDSVWKSIAVCNL